MANGYKLYQACPACGGKGERSVYAGASSSTITCVECGGDGIVFFGWCTEGLFEMPAITADPADHTGE